MSAVSSRRIGAAPWALLVVAALPALAGCSQSFWDRSPAASRVQGIYARGPLADVNGPAPVAAADWNKNPELTGDPDGLTGDPDGGSSASARAVAVPTQHDLAALTEVNRLRAQQGLAPVRYEARLYAAAYAHSLEQMKDGYLGHDSRDPARATLGQRVGLEGYVGRTYAEVVAKDFPDARSVVAAWMDSPRHREVLLDPDLTEAAFARVDGPANRTNRWTGDFADPGRSFTPIPAPTPQPQTPPPAPSQATRVSVPPAPVRSGTLSPAAGPPSRPPVPATVAPSTFPPPSASAPAVKAAPSQPRVAPPPPPPAPRSVASGADGNIVPPAAGMRASAPARPYVPPVAAAPSVPPSSAPRAANPPMASAPRPAQPTAAPRTAPRPPYRPAPPTRRPKDCKT
jgi:hypothetical protein